MKTVTFDSNTYRRVVDPSMYPDDPHHADLVAVRRALQSGRIEGLLSETVLTLEAIQKAQRGQYFASAGTAAFVHPGLNHMIDQWRQAALTLGLRFMRAPRIGVPRPQVMLDADFVVEDDGQVIEQRQTRFFALGRELDLKGVGLDVAKNLGSRLNANSGSISSPWYEGMNRARNIHEAREIERAVGEWADGDTVAAHFAYASDVLCSEDLGKSTGGVASVFDPANRRWLTHQYGVHFVTIPELAVML